jgi:hypothetical protein
MSALLQGNVEQVRTSGSVSPIAIEFRDDGFLLRQVRKEGRVAIYEKSKMVNLGIMRWCYCEFDQLKSSLAAHTRSEKVIPPLKIGEFTAGRIRLATLKEPVGVSNNSSDSRLKTAI